MRVFGLWQNLLNFHIVGSSDSQRIQQNIDLLQRLAKIEL
jgi:hypothetical protein